MLQVTDLSREPAVKAGLDRLIKAVEEDRCAWIVVGVDSQKIVSCSWFGV